MLTMRQRVAAYMIALVAFGVLDAAIIFSFGAQSYKNTLGDVLAEQPHIWPVLVFYPLFIFGLCHFAVFPALRVRNRTVAASNGAIYGLCTYATYALTCYAAIRNWSLQLALTDICGGTLIGAAVALFAYLGAARIRV